MSETVVEDRETDGERESETLLEDIVDKKRLFDVSCVEMVWLWQKRPGADEAGLQNMPAGSTSQDGEHNKPLQSPETAPPH